MKNEIIINNCDKIIIKATKARNKINKKENTITTKESGYIILYRVAGEYKTAVEILGGNAPDNLQGVISTNARNIGLEAAYSAAGLVCPPAITKAAKAERKAAKERDKKREERERAIIAAGKSALEKTGADSYGARYERLCEKYGVKGND